MTTSFGFLLLFHVAYAFSVHFTPSALSLDNIATLEFWHHQYDYEEFALVSSKTLFSCFSVETLIEPVQRITHPNFSQVTTNVKSTVRGRTHTVTNDSILVVQISEREPLMVAWTFESIRDEIALYINGKLIFTIPFADDCSRAHHSLGLRGDLNIKKLNRPRQISPAASRYPECANLNQRAHESRERKAVLCAWDSIWNETFAHRRYAAGVLKYKSAMASSHSTHKSSPLSHSPDSFDDDLFNDDAITDDMFTDDAITDDMFTDDFFNDDGFYDDGFYDDDDDSSKSKSNSAVYIYIGVGVGALLFIIAIIVVAVCMCSSSSKPTKVSIKPAMVAPVAIATATATAVKNQSTQSNHHHKFHAFLSHCWGNDIFNRDNHERVEAINKALQKEGIITWFDGEQMAGSVMESMTKGIDESKTVVVFITQRYCDKVNLPSNGADNCQIEFTYAARMKNPRELVVVVMESSMLDTTKWIGKIGNDLQCHEVINLSFDFDQMSSASKRFSDEIKALAGHIREA